VVRRLFIPVSTLCLLIAGCHAPSKFSRAPFDHTIVGFSKERLGNGSYKVMYVGRWGASFAEVHQALENHVRSLCRGQYDLEIQSETITAVDHVQTEGGVAQQGVATCKPGA
jgi:hypothetical protein